VLALAVYVAVAGHALRPLEVRDYDLRRCELAGGGDGVLRVLDAVYLEELGMLDTWCAADGPPWRYAALEVRSVHRDHLDLRELFEARYDLVLAKPELMSGRSPAGNLATEYALLAHYPPYGSQLVSLRGVPELSRAWLQGKRLGLLDDPNSVSAYQIPLAALREHDLVDAVEIVYFRSYRELYRALFEGGVDVIPALLSAEGLGSAVQLPPGLVLQQTIPGPAWYLRRDLLDTPAHCELQAAVTRLAATVRFDYLRDVNVVRPCHAP